VKEVDRTVKRMASGERCLSLRGWACVPGGEIGGGWGIRNGCQERGEVSMSRDLGYRAVPARGDITSKGEKNQSSSKSYWGAGSWDQLREGKKKITEELWEGYKELQIEPERL